MNTNGAGVTDRPLRVGDETTSPGRTITEADLVGFASLTGDWHPQHADAEWAGAGRFGERVAHGMMVLSYAVGLVAFDPERVVALRGLGSATFKRPVRIGDTIRVRSRVAEVRPLEDGVALVELEWRITNQDDEVVARARPVALWRVGDADASSGAGEPGDPTDLYGERVLL
jgi:3-hydroxybutyryl-CoA dehydratase